MKKFSFGLVWKSFKDAFKGFGDDKVTKLSASLAYYTVFSLAPLLIVIISICGFFFGAEAVQGTIDEQVQGFIGQDAAKQLQEMVKSAAISGKGVMATVIGVVTLLIGATSIFAEIQDSINSIWGLKPKPKVGILKTLQNRLLSFGLIGSLGFLLLVSLAATTVVEGIGDRLKAYLPNVTVVLFYVVNLILTLGVTTALFAVIFKVLPDAKIKWKDIWMGAFVTSLLFVLGKFAISLYIGKTEVGSTYGAAGSLAVILVWIYYSSIILYFGAEFAKAYAINKGATIVPNHYAEWSKEPAVPGAEPKQPPAKKASGQETETAELPEEQSKQRQPVLMQNTSSPSKTESRKSSSIGTALLGLILYFISNRREPKTGVPLRPAK